MKKYLILLLVFYHSIALATKPTLEEVRKLFSDAQTEETSCKELIDLLEPYNETNNPLYFGYKGSATILLANHVTNPFTKLSNFRKGRKMLEKAIESDKGNSELIFLRFAIQTHVPSFLGYNKNIQKDKELLYSSLPVLKDNKLKKDIADYLKHVAGQNKY